MEPQDETTEHAAPADANGADAQGAPGGFAVPTRDQARAKREQEREGFWFPLPRTGGAAHVRWLSLADKSCLAGLPLNLQAKGLEAFTEIGDIPRATTVQQYERNRDRLERIANVLCLVGFVRPRLVTTEDELDPADPHCWLVSDLHVEERISYANLVTGRVNGPAAGLVPFRPPADGPAGGGAGDLPAVPDAAVAVGGAAAGRGRVRR